MMLLSQSLANHKVSYKYTYWAPCYEILTLYTMRIAKTKITRVDKQRVVP